jgi:hypothetical protein
MTAANSSHTLRIHSDLKQAVGFSPLLLDVALDYAITNVYHDYTYDNMRLIYTLYQLRYRTRQLRHVSVKHGVVKTAIRRGRRHAHFSRIS